MNTLVEERFYPRIKKKLKVDISTNILGETIDVSEGGLRFTSTQDISSPTISLRIHLLPQKLEFAVLIVLSMAFA